MRTLTNYFMAAAIGVGCALALIHWMTPCQGLC